MTPRRFLSLLESGPVAQHYGQLWLQAREFFDQRQDELSHLPEGSPDRAKAEAALGIVNQYKLDDNSTDVRARDTALIMADRLDSLFAKAPDADDGGIRGWRSKGS